MIAVLVFVCGVVVGWATISVYAYIVGARAERKAADWVLANSVRTAAQDDRLRRALEQMRES